MTCNRGTKDEMMDGWGDKLMEGGGRVDSNPAEVRQRPSPSLFGPSLSGSSLVELGEVPR